MFDQVYELTENEFQSKYRYELEAMVEGSAGNKIQYEFYDFSPKLVKAIDALCGLNNTKANIFLSRPLSDTRFPV